MNSLPKCPQCPSIYTYKDVEMFVCPECAHEWRQETADENMPVTPIYKDAHGNVLHDGDTVSVIKDLPIKGSSQTIKIGTKVKNIKLIEGDHDIDCKIDGIGSMKLKSQFVKKI